MASVSTPSSNARRGGQAKYVSLLFSNAGLLLFLAVLILAAWFGQVPIAVLTGLIISTIGTAKLWSYLSLRRVKYERFLGMHRFFPGEETQLKVRITNRKPLPLLWLDAEDHLPRGLAVDSEGASGRGLSLSTALLWYQRISWAYSLKGEKRGYYRLGPAQLTSGDVFGLFPRSTSQPDREEVIVYPQVYPLAELGLPTDQLWGDIRTHNLFHDITRFNGIRDYRPQDSLKHIHWKASARRGALQVKTFESTATLEALLLVPIDSFSKASDEDFELALSTAASLAFYLSQRDCPVGLVANTATADTGEPLAILPGSDPVQLTRVLEALAKATFAVNSSVQTLLESCFSRRVAPGTTFVVISAGYPFELACYLERYRNLGYRSTVLSIGEAAGLADATSPAYQVRRPHQGAAPSFSAARIA